LQADAALHVITPAGLFCRSFAIGTGLCEFGEILLRVLDPFLIPPVLVYVPFNARIPFMPWDLVVEATPESTGVASHNRGFRSFVVYLSRVTCRVLAVDVIPLYTHRFFYQEKIILGERRRVRPQSDIVMIQELFAITCGTSNALYRTFPHYLALHGFPHAVDADLTLVGACSSRRLEWEEFGFITANRTRFVRLCWSGLDVGLRRDYRGSRA